MRIFSKIRNKLSGGPGYEFSESSPAEAPVSSNSTTPLEFALKSWFDKEIY